MTIKKEIFPTLDKKKKLNPCSLTKEKVESHLLDIALFLDSLQESRILLWTLGSGETQFLDSSFLVKPQKLYTLVFTSAQ